MKKYFYLVLVLAMLNGCVTTGKVAIVSPTTPEEELKDKVRETLDRSKEPEPRPDNSKSPQVEKASGIAVDESDKPIRETRRASIKETAVVGEDKLNALINLLEKKGIIDKSELTGEINRLKDQEN